MLSNITKLLFLSVFLAFCAAAPRANSAPSQTPEAFIRSFYESLDLTEQDPKRIEDLQIFFAEPLYQLLLTNELYRYRNKEAQICGYLDTDPFYDTRDGDKEIKYVHIAQNPHHTLVAIAFKFDVKPYLIVKLINQNNEWKIINFFYPNEVTEKHRDLITLLRMAHFEPCSEKTALLRSTHLLRG